jgi:hypothetical protein
VPIALLSASTFRLSHLIFLYFWNCRETWFREIIVEKAGTYERLVSLRALVPQIEVEVDYKLDEGGKGKEGADESENEDDCSETGICRI